MSLLTRNRTAWATWDYGQLYRLHMIRAQAAQDIPRWVITEQLPHPNGTIGQSARHRCHQRTIDNNEALHEVKEPPPNRRTSSSIDRCRLRNLLRSEPHRYRPQSSSGNIKIPSKFGTYPQSWTPDRNSQACQRVQSAKGPTLTTTVMRHRALQFNTGTASLKPSSA